MFAMTYEKDPARFQDVPSGLLSWIQIAGGWAAFGVLLWLLIGYTRLRDEDRARIPPWLKAVFLTGVAVAALAYVLAGIATGIVLASGSAAVQMFQSICLAAGGAGALLAAGAPFAANLPSLRLRRIWALTKLSFKEAIRRRVLYAFSFLLLVFLFASWFIPHKPEDQVRIYVAVVYRAMSILLLVTAVVLTAFSIPTDIRQQTIHTIVTKPVERFEILLGRFFGFTALMTLVLLFMTTVSVVYVLRGIDQEAREESLKARQPLYGKLRYENTKSEKEATNVGREWNYRSYITAPSAEQLTQYAVWDFPSVSRALGDRQQVRCEFTFDIYRTTKGFENRGVSCEFEFQTANFDKSQKDQYNQERGRLLAQPDRPSDTEIDDQLAEKFGYFVVPAKDITDYHTLYIDVPAGLFRNALKSQPASRPLRSEAPPPPLQVRVSVTRQSITQYVGMAERDLYWRLDDPYAGGEKAAFTYNFYKGILGLWFQLCLVIGLCVAVSTYLSGVITLLVVASLYVGGQHTDFVKSLAAGTAPGGGPMEAMVRLANRQVALVPLEETTAAKVATTSDIGSRLLMRLVLTLLPDVDSYYFTNYVADGFNVPITGLEGEGLLYAFGRLLLYLLPWIVFGYYLIKWREIAAPT